MKIDRLIEQYLGEGYADRHDPKNNRGPAYTEEHKRMEDELDSLHDKISDENKKGNKKDQKKIAAWKKRIDVVYAKLHKAGHGYGVNP